jgi:predicted small metal-binding protein
VTAYGWRRIAASIAEVYHRLIEHYERHPDAHKVANVGGIFN